MTKTLAMVFSAFWLGACATSGGSSTSTPVSTTVSKPAYCAFEESNAALCIGHCSMHQAQGTAEGMHAYHTCIHTCNATTPRPECR
jgi:hypothetical protein